MNIFCPFFKDRCKGNECVMWKDEKCLIISFMENCITPPEEEVEELERIGREMRGIREMEVPDEIKSATEEELAAELIAFTKKEFPGEEMMPVSYVSEIFWKTKNVSEGDIPAEIELKIRKAEMLAGKELDFEMAIKQNEQIEKENEQLEKEKNELPSLINSCVDWARGHGLKTVTKADIEAFLIDRNIEILPKTQRSLYALVNVKLKSKH